jgi:taurine transport system substrate-binding protein
LCVFSTKTPKGEGKKVLSKNITLVCLGLVLAGLAAAATSATAKGQSTSGKSNPSTITLTYFESGDPMQDDLIATMPSLQKLIPAKIKWAPVQSGPSALAGYKAGAYDFVQSVGNPPVVGAMAANLPFHVIWPETEDGTVLVVKPSIKSIKQLAGTTIGDLIGSSEDYELRGFLAANGLSKSVKIVQLGNMQSTVPAFKRGQIDGAYADYSFALAMAKNGGGRFFRSVGGHLINADYICTQFRYCSFNSSTVSDAFAKKYPTVVQAVVCALAKATEIEQGPKAARDAAFKRAADFLGITEPSLAVQGGEHYPTVSPQKVASYLNGSGVYLKSIVKTAAFLRSQGVLTSPLTAAQIRAHIDGRWAANVMKGKCPS